MKALLSLSFLSVCLQANTITLYDASLNTAPEAQGWLAVGALPGTAINSNASGTTVNTTLANSLYAGYSNYTYVINLLGPTISPGTFVNAGFPTLNRASGFTLTFRLQMNNQTNDGANGPNRAGFSVTLLASDSQGIEIGFRTSDVFSQGGPTFTVGEINNDASLAAMLASMTTYELTILNNTYTLMSGGNTILTGAIRDYTSAVGFASDGYRATNFLAMGDNTTSARASFTLQQVSITTVPEPGTWALAGVALAALLQNSKRKPN